MKRHRDMTKWLRRICKLVFQLNLLCIASLFVTASVHAKPDKIRFGIVPQQSASRLAQVWAPVIAHIAKETGLGIEFATAPDIPTFEACLDAGAFQIAYMNPYHYIVGSKSRGYRAFARQQGSLQGIVVVKKDSPIKNLSALDGLEIAFPAPAAFGASVLPRAEIAAASVKITPRYVHSHDSVYRAVASGLLPAGGGIMRTFNNVPQALRFGLKIIHTTAEYTPHAIAALPSIDEPTAEKIAVALQALSVQAPYLLEPLGVSGFERARDADWDDIRRLNISRTDSGINSGWRRCPFD